MSRISKRRARKRMVVWRKRWIKRGLRDWMDTNMRLAQVEWLLDPGRHFTTLDYWASRADDS